MVIAMDKVMDPKEEYNGTEKRSGFCPVHHIKCGEIDRNIETLQKDTKARVPIWVFSAFVVMVGTVLGYLNMEAVNKSTAIQLLLKEHIEKSNIILTDIRTDIRATQHGLNEVAINQTRVMKKLDLEFETIPHYNR